MASSRYINDTEALPPALVERCRAAIGGYYLVVTFRAGGPLTKTEAQLGPVLAQECRTVLAAHWKRERSIRVYVQGTRVNGRMSKAESAAITYLSRNGHSAEAIADVLGVAASTVRSSVSWADGGVQRLPTAADEPAGANVLRKRLGKAHPHTTLVELAARLGVPLADVRHRAMAAGAAYRDLAGATR